jgi:hypothetical protein
VAICHVTRAVVVGDECGWWRLTMVMSTAVSSVAGGVDEHGGGGGKKSDVFGDHDCQTNIVCWPTSISDLPPTTLSPPTVQTGHG